MCTLYEGRQNLHQGRRLTSNFSRFRVVEFPDPSIAEGGLVLWCLSVECPIGHWTDTVPTGKKARNRSPLSCEKILGSEARPPYQLP